MLTRETKVTMNSQSAKAVNQRSLVGLLDDRSRSQAESVAFRYKHDGEWLECTWAKYREQAEGIAAGLVSRGFGPGDRLAIICDPVAGWLFCDLGAQAAGGIVLGISPNADPDDLAHFLQDSGARTVVVADRAQLQKVLAAEPSEHIIEDLIVIDHSSLAEADERVLSLEELKGLGLEHLESVKGFWETQVKKHGDGAMLNSIFYTSGTTGRPKGVTHSTNSIVDGWSPAFSKALPTSGDRTTAYMPLSSIAERWPTIYLPIVFGVVAHLPGSETQLVAAFKETRPTLMIGTPRMWEEFATGANDGTHDQSAIGEPVAPVGHEDAIAGDRELADGMRVREQFGVDALRFVLIGGSSLSPELVRQWQRWGVELREMYASTECGVVSAQVDGEVIPGMGSPVLAGVDVAADQGAGVIVKSAGLFSGYWNNESATAAGMSESGFRTGDLAEIVERDGTRWLRIADRVSNLITLSDGEQISPAEYEATLKSNAQISQAVLVGQGRPYLSVLVELGPRPNAETSLSARKLVAEYLAEANAIFRARSLPEVMRYRILPQRVDQYPDVVTGTGKLRRAKLLEVCADLVDEMYVDVNDQIDS
jgi:long-chain acyl-CoA synthetase